MLEKLQLPPFGHILLAYQQASIRLDFPVYIFVGKNAKYDAIGNLQRGDICTYLPYGDSFERYNWPIFDQYTVVVDTGNMTLLHLKRFCLHLVNLDPRIVYLSSEEHQCDFLIPKGRIYYGG